MMRLNSCRESSALSGETLTDADHWMKLAFWDIFRICFWSYEEEGPTLSNITVQSSTRHVHVHPLDTLLESDLLLKTFPQRFWSMVTSSHSCCRCVVCIHDETLPFHLKGALLDWDLSTVNSSSCFRNQFETMTKTVPVTVTWLTA